MQDQKKIAHERWLDAVRFRWHEAVLKDRQVRNHRNALALAGHIMHRYVSKKGHAQFSAASAAKALDMPQRSVRRAARVLRDLGWIISLQDEPQHDRWGAARYRLGGGPNDLLFESSTGDTADTGDDMS